MCFSNEIISIGRAFTPGQALSFGSLDYVVAYSGELHLLVAHCRKAMCSRHLPF